MQDIQAPAYGVDILELMDATTSMAPVIEVAKKQAIGFYGKLQTALGAKGKSIGRIRVGVLVFRDVYCDGDRAFEQSPFFELPAEQAEFERFVQGIQPIGGGDEPESGLEALGLALRSKFATDLAKQRHIIVVHTDASAHRLEKAQESGRPANYPAGIPTTFDALSDLWASQELNAEAKRLVLFAPDSYPWSDISTHWTNTVHYASRAGEGLSEVDGETIMDAIINSMRN
jgi:hypothetical protein